MSRWCRGGGWVVGEREGGVKVKLKKLLGVLLKDKNVVSIPL